MISLSSCSRQISALLLTTTIPTLSEPNIQDLSTQERTMVSSDQLMLFERKISPDNASLRVAIVPQGDLYTISVLGGQRLGKESLRKLVHKDRYSFVINGTFFEGDYTLGDVVGVRAQDPNKPLSIAFSAKRPWMTQRIAQRFAFAIDLDGNATIVRRNSIKDPSSGQPLKSAQLKTFYQSFLGGLTAVDLRNPNVMRSIIQNDDARFIHDFNTVNGRLNHTSAYDGLEGRASLARSAIGIIAHNGKTSVVLMSVGQGTRRDRGTSIIGLTHEFVRIARDLKAQPLQLAFLDGASSTFSASPSMLALSGGQPTTALAVKPVETLANTGLYAKR